MLLYFIIKKWYCSYFSISNNVEDDFTGKAFLADDFCTYNVAIFDFHFKRTKQISTFISNFQFCSQKTKVVFSIKSKRGRIIYQTIILILGFVSAHQVIFLYPYFR